MAEEGYAVKLHVYDLSQGLARQLSMTFLGKAIEAIWHTGLVVYGKEYYFSGGIQQDPAGKTPFGTPMRVVDLGVTHIPMEVFEEFLQEISPRYTTETYNLLTHNCNNFSNEVSQFLVSVSIPDYILQLPNEVMNSPMGALIMPMIQRLETTLKAGAVPQVPQFIPQTSTVRPAVPAKVTAAPPKTATLEQGTETKRDSANSPAKTAKVGRSATLSAKPAAVTAGAKHSSDPLGEARSRVQEEITREFAAIMATGTLRASEAAALAARRVLERHGRLNVS